MDAVNPHQEDVKALRNRRMIELLQETRVVQTGVQVLFAFLIGLPFTTRFDELGGVQRASYLPTLMLAGAAIALLSAPTAHHRMLFRRFQRDRILTLANRLVLGGLVCIGLAMAGVVFLVSGLLYPLAVASALAAFILALFFGLWFAVPLYVRRAEGRTASRLAEGQAAPPTASDLAT